jgi:protease IV
VKSHQKLIIISILLLPILLGAILNVLDYKDGSSLTSGSLKKIGLVKVEGVINQSYDCVRQLRSFRQDNTIAGVLLRIDSPGGAVAPSQEIYEEVMNFKAQKKPLIVSMGTVAASGGYYIACPSQRIFANPGTLTGSIGVIMTIPLFEGLAKKVGVEMRTYKAGKFKDITSPYRAATEQEQTLLQSLLDDTHNQFIADISKARNIPFDTIRKIADGRVFTGRQALGVHLVDTMGGYQDAIAYIKQISGVSSKTKLVERDQKSSFFKEFLTEEIIHLFPQAYHFMGQPGLQFLFSVQQ